MAGQGDELPSILELLPIDRGGRIAQEGFNYQHHVGASFCFDMLERENLSEIWFECHDDLTLIWKVDDGILVEFVQVKATNRASRWSIPSLTENIGRTEDSSLFHKSLAQARGREPVKFRIVSKYDVNHDLAVLRLDRSSAERSDASDRINSLATQISNRVGESTTSPNGVTVLQWCQKCYWDKQPDSREALIAKNEIRFQEILSSRGLYLAIDQMRAVYSSLLRKISDACVSDINVDPDSCKITKGDLESWLESRIERQTISDSTGRPLVNKMDRAGISQDSIQSAIELRESFFRKRIRPEYTQVRDIDSFESDMCAVLNHQLSRLDGGKLNLTGEEFHLNCLNEIRRQFDEQGYEGFSLADAQGYMYERTNRCVYRFDEAQP